MRKRLEYVFDPLSLAQRFMLASFVILVSGMLGVAWWVSQQIETGVIHRTAATTALYVDSFVAPQVQELSTRDSITADHIATLNQLLHQTDFGRQIVSFKVWNEQGRVLYSTNVAIIGNMFPVQWGLARAWQGDVMARISDLHDEENAFERPNYKRLLEVYSPVRRDGSNQIIAVAEFYQAVEDLQDDIDSAQRQSWLLFGAVTLVMYLLLAGFVQRTSNTIARQEKELSRQISRLTDLLGQNAEMHDRVRRAAARTTALNERFLRRITADLHDGPAQDISLALLKLDKVIARAETVRAGVDDGGLDAPALTAISQSLNHALQEVRAISAGVGLPKLQNLTVRELLVRVVRSHEQRTASQVKLSVKDLPEQAPLSVKITLYRLVEEALSNAFQHAGGVGQQVDVVGMNGQLEVEVVDKGPGLGSLQESGWDEHLGVVGMRERVESLAGTFRIESQSGGGTRVFARLPLQVWYTTVST